MITEAWQREICVRDCLHARTLISSIANMLYPETLMAASREAELLQIPEMGRLAAICTKKVKELNAEIGEWDAIHLQTKAS